jgi:tetratricopeptide (TPR) repeat protein
MEPNNGQIWAAKAQFNAFRGQIQEAAAAWERSVILCPDNAQIREDAMTFFLMTENKDLNRRGRKILDDALAANRQDFRLQIWQSRILLREKTAPSFDKAIDILTKVTAACPSDIDGWNLLCDAWLQKKEPAKALDAVLRGLTFAPENKPLLLLKAHAEAVHVPELAIPTVKLLHEQDPNDADITVYLAGLYVHGSNYKAAIAVLDDHLDRTDPVAQRKITIARAVTLHKSGDKMASHALFDSLRKEDPNDTAIMLAEADLFVDEQRWDELVEYVVRWYRTHDNNANAVLSVVAELSPNTNTPDGKAAEKILHTALVINLNVPQLMAELARRLYVSDRATEAAALYQRLVEIDPQDLEAINNFAWITCENQHDYAQALELAQKGLALSPDYLDLIDTRGVAYFRLGKFDKAIDDFAACAKLYPDHLPSATASYFHLGRAYAALAKKDDAVKYLKMALESNQKNGGLSTADASEAKTLLDSFLKG